MHITISSDLVSKYNMFQLERVSMLEQNMACGEDPSGKTYRTALADLRALLSREDLTLSPVDKMRLLMALVITQRGIKQHERRELIELAALSPEDQVPILNLFYLGVSLLHGVKGASKGRAEGRAEGAQPESSYDVSRYMPPLRRIVEQALEGGLSRAEYPQIGQEAQNRVHGAGSKLIVFIVGGVTYSECREMHLAAARHGTTLVLGSTQLLTPQRFIRELKGLKDLEADLRI